MSKETALAQATGLTPGAVESVTQAPAPETPTEQQTLDSSRFAHLAKKESELVKNRTQFKKEQEEFAQEKAQAKEVIDRYTKFKELSKTNIFKALQAEGFSDTEIFNSLVETQAQNEDPAVKAQKAAQAEIDKFKKEQADKEQAQVKAQNESVIKKFRTDITTFIQSDKDKFEFCNYVGPEAEDLIYTTVAEDLKRTGNLMEVSEAAKLVEDYYEETYKSMSKLRKVTPREAAQAVKEKIEQLKPEVSARPASKTLTAKTTASVASTVTRRESPSEKRERLISKLLNGG